MRASIRARPLLSARALYPHSLPFMSRSLAFICFSSEFPAASRLISFLLDNLQLQKSYFERLPFSPPEPKQNEESVSHNRISRSPLTSGGPADCHSLTYLWLCLTAFPYGTRNRPSLFVSSGARFISSDTEVTLKSSMRAIAEDDGGDNRKNLATDDNRRRAVDPTEYSILREGEADILLHHGNDVFYNKTQIVNRDMSIAVLRAFVAKRQEEHGLRRISKPKESVRNNQPQAEHVSTDSPCTADHLNASVANDFVAVNIDQQIDAESIQHVDSADATLQPLCVLEAFSASGVRALRYAREVDSVGSVVALDNDKVAFEAIKRNVRLNGSVAISKVQAELADARMYMLTHEKQFDVVDVDPYGSPSLFLDSAVQCVADGGLLMCTATDMAVLCGKDGEVCYCKYGSYPVRGKYCHEMALRILLGCIESHAIRHKRYIVPLLSISVDFYVRVFVRIFTSAPAIKASPSKLSYVYQCVGCDSFHLQPLARIVHKRDRVRYMPATGPVFSPECKHCGNHFNMGGPIWSQPIHDPNWVSLIFKNVVELKKCYPAYEKMHSILTMVSEELLDVPLFLDLHSISATLKCNPLKSDMFRFAIANAGYRVSGSHANPLGLKTDAPMDVVWDIMRCWVKRHPVKAQPTHTPGSIILSKEPVLEANFSKVSSALSKSQSKGVPRFLPNPEEFWGPMPRAGRRVSIRHIYIPGAMACNATSETVACKKYGLKTNH